MALISACTAADSGGPLPSWAVGQGRDSYGAWADFEVAGERVRLRKIPKGTFVMGSPEAEQGRGPDEQPHEVTFTHDLWLAESESTQALWTSLMDKNPSRFVGDGWVARCEG